MKKFIIGLSLALLPLMLATSILAAIGTVSDFVANPNSTAIYLWWTKASGSTNTTIRYSTVTYPATTADGTLAYNGDLNYAAVTGLTSGRTYYFSAWGWNSVDGFSATASNVVMTTLLSDLSSGTAPTVASTIAPPPTLGTGAKQAVDISGLNFRPASDLLRYFVTDGLGMPVNNAAEWGFAVIIVALGFLVYGKTRSFFAAFAVVLLLSMFGVKLHLLQEFLIGIEIVIAAGIWGIEKYYQ
jgi:hypothetical protein